MAGREGIGLTAGGGKGCAETHEGATCGAAEPPAVPREPGCDALSHACQQQFVRDLHSYKCASQHGELGDVGNIWNDELGKERRKEDQSLGVRDGDKKALAKHSKQPGFT